LTPRTSQGVRLALAGVGVAISAYLVAVHYGHVPLYCADQGIVDCASVLTSPQSSWFGLPVAAFGVLWFLVAGLLALRARSAAAGPAVRTANMAWLLVGAATVIYLVYLELVVVGRICLWCTAVHIIVLGSLFLAILAEA
jgi:uncharacterized membrane protein